MFERPKPCLLDHRKLIYSWGEWQMTVCSYLRGCRKYSDGAKESIAELAKETFILASPARRVCNQFKFEGERWARLSPPDPPHAIK